MKTISVERIVHDTKFESFDGQVFNSSEECKNHEYNIRFNEFAYDESKAVGEITVENWKHYMFKFLQLFYSSPETGASLLMEETHTRRNLFDIDIVKSWFLSEFIQQFQISMILNERDNELKESASRDMLKVMEFFVSSGMLKLDEIANKFYAVKGGYHNEEITQERKNEFFLNYMWGRCFSNDALEVLDICIEKFGLDLNQYVFNRRFNSWGTHSFNADLITNLACEELERTDCFRRVKWLEYLIKKDLSVRIVRYKTAKMIAREGKLFYSDVKEGEEKFIYFPIDDLISQVKKAMSNPEIYLFKKNNDKVVELLENCGDNFRNANKDNKKDEFYILIEESVKIIKEVFENHPKINLVFEDKLFTIKRIVSENMPYNSGKNTDYHRHAKEIIISTILDIFNQIDESGKTNLIQVKDFTKSGWASDKYEHKCSFPLDKFLGDPSALATEIIYYLTEGKMTISSTRINEIDIKILDIKNRQKELEKELSELEAEKLKTINLKEKK